MHTDPSPVRKSVNSFETENSKSLRSTDFSHAHHDDNESQSMIYRK